MLAGALGLITRLPGFGRFIMLGAIGIAVAAGLAWAWRMHATIHNQELALQVMRQNNATLSATVNNNAAELARYKQIAEASQKSAAAHAAIERAMAVRLGAEQAAVSLAPKAKSSAKMPSLWYNTMKQVTAK